MPAFPHQNAPPVSVIVPVLNGEATLRQCLTSLLKTDYPARHREILVVDNGSTDRTEEIVKSFPVRYLCEPRRGAAFARNRGIEASRGQFLAFTDVDCVVTTNWIREMVRGFDSEEIGGVEGEVMDFPGTSPVERYLARRRTWSRQARDHNPLAPFVVTANVAFRREVFECIGSFDVRFPDAGGEDVDISWRFFRDSGLSINYNPKMVVFHRHRASQRDFFRQQFRNGRALAILQCKYPERLPWTWQKELSSWVRIGNLGGSALAAKTRYYLFGGNFTKTQDASLTFLAQLGIRAGFICRWPSEKRRFAP